MCKHRDGSSFTTTDKMGTTELWLRAGRRRGGGNRLPYFTMTPGDHINKKTGFYLYRNMMKVLGLYQLI